MTTFGHRTGHRENTMKRLLALVVVALSANSAMGQARGSPPVDVSFTQDIEAGKGCDFPVRWDATGKSSTISLPGNRLISTGPTLRVVVTNLADSSKSVTLNIEGAGHISFGPQ